jgi:hypothetical protein
VLALMSKADASLEVGYRTAINTDNRVVVCVMVRSSGGGEEMGQRITLTLTITVTVIHNTTSWTWTCQWMD